MSILLDDVCGCRRDIIWNASTLIWVVIVDRITIIAAASAASRDCDGEEYMVMITPAGSSIS